jgi:flavin-dependent dehydrogenase
MKATSLLRLASSTDGFEGLAWCIPLGNYVSLGVSVDPEVTPQRSSLLLDWLERAYALRGLEVRRNFPERSAPQDFVYEHFNHERCAGANWLLTGPTCCQFWFPAAAGVATGLIAARLAAGFLRAPKQTAAVYQDYIDGLAAAHGGLEWLVRDDPWSVSAEELQQRMQKMVIGNVKRFSRAPGIQRTSSELGLGDAFLRLYQADRVLTNLVRVETAVPAVRL